MAMYKYAADGSEAEATAPSAQRIDPDNRTLSAVLRGRWLVLDHPDLANLADPELPR
jgi:hypothetical protein